MKPAEPSFLTLARRPDLDEETAFTICRMIDSVGWQLVEKWDWNWLKRKNWLGKPRKYRSLIKPALLEGAWKLLFEKDWYSQQTTNDVDKRISTITPLDGLVNLRTLVLQNNLIEDLGPVSGMLQLRDLNCYSNRIRDLSPLRNLESLEELSLDNNPVQSFRVLEELPELRELSISADQIPVFVDSKQFPALRVLSISGDAPIESFADFPEMPCLKALRARYLKDLAGIERLNQLETLDLSRGDFASLDLLSELKTLTHLDLSTSKSLEVEPLSKLSALRSLSIDSPKILGLSSLASLPVLHELDIDDEAASDVNELEALRGDLTPWDREFRAEGKRTEAGVNLEIVDQETFDYFDSKAPFGILPGEVSDRGMFRSERRWLLENVREALSVKFEDDKDFHLPHTNGLSRTERVIIYSMEAYESFRDIAATIQTVLSETRNDWIIWCQSLLGESPEEQEVPEDAEDFIVWIYRDKVMVSEEHAGAVRKLVEWGR